MFFYVFFCNFIKVNHFLYRFNIFYYIQSLLFHFVGSLLIPYGYVSIESIDCILLSSFELKAVLSISSVKTLCLSLLNLCCVLDIDLLFFINFYEFFNTIYVNFFYFFLDNLFYSQVELLLNSFHNLSFLFMTQFFVPFSFLSLLPSSIK